MKILWVKIRGRDSSSDTLRKLFLARYGYEYMPVLSKGIQN